MYPLRQTSKEEFDFLIKKRNLSFDELTTFYQCAWVYGVFLAKHDFDGLGVILEQHENTFPESKGWAMLTKAYIMSVSSRQKEAQQIFEEVIHFFEERNDISGMGSCYCMLGMGFRTMGVLDKAKEHIDRAIELINEGTIYKNFKVVAHYQGGELHTIFKDWEAAQKHYEAGMKIVGTDGPMQSRFMNGIGNILFNKGEYKEAIESFVKSGKEVEGENNFRMDSKNYSDMASCYLGLNEIEKSVEYLNRSLSLRLQNGQMDAAITDYIKLAEIYLLEGNINLALEQAETADRLAIEMGITIKELQSKNCSQKYLNH